MNYIDFKIPDSLPQARAWLKELGGQGMPVSGSTLHVFLRDEAPKVAVDISRIGLGGVSGEAGQFRIGATATVADLEMFAADGWVLDRVAREFVTQPIRNVATIGGSIVRVFPWSDWPVPLLALAAQLEIVGDEVRVMSSTDFFATQPFHHLQPGDLLSAFTVPALASGQGFSYFKERRTTTDFSRCTVAVWMALAGTQIADVRVAVGAAVPMPCRMPAIESALRGAKAGAAVFAEAVAQGLDTARWKGLHGISDEYARHLASVRIVDALNSAQAEAGGES
jgi:aerobic carbon-monoxide dehydrogenase medium subunit